MADLEKTIKLIFAGQDDVSRTINSVGRGLDDLAGRVSSATQPLADLADSILKINTVLVGLSAGALVVATVEAGRFGDSFKEISTLIDVPADKLSRFKDDILDYSRDSTQSLENINSAIYNAISSGEDYTTALDLLHQAELLGVATKADLNTAINILKPTLNAFGMSTKEAADFADILFTTVKSGKTTLSELEPVLANVTGIASGGGVSFDALAAAIAGLTASGAPTAQAVTQIKSALVGILAPTDAARKAAAALGIELGAEAIEARGLDGVLKDLYEATGGNVAQMKALLPRIEGANAAIILGKDAAGKYADALDAMSGRAGAAETAYGKMADKFELINQKIVNNLKATLVEAGTPLLDEWGKIAEGIVNIFKGVSVGFDEGSFDPLINWVEKNAEALAKEFEGIAKALPEALEDIDWSGFTQSLDELVGVGKNLFKELFGSLDLTKPDDLEKAIQKVVDTFEKWVDLTSGVVAGLTPFLGKLSDIAGEFSKLDGETVKGLGSITGWGKAINTVANFIPNLTAPLKLLSGSIGLLGITQIPAFVKALLPLTAGLKGLGLAFAPFAALALTFEALTPDAGLGKWLRENSTLFKSFAEGVDDAVLALGGYDVGKIKAIESEAAHTKAMGDTMVQVAKLVEKIEGVPEQKTLTIDTELSGFFDEVDLEEWKLENLTGYEIKVTADTTQAQDELKKVSEWNKIILDDGTEIIIPVSVDAAGAEKAAADAKQKIDEKLPSEKLVEIQLQGEIDIELEKIKATAETLQSAFEWSAKVKITGLEAEAKKIEAIAGVIESAWKSTGDVISTALGAISDVQTGTSQFHLIEKSIDAEIENRKGLLQSTQDLTKAEVKLLDARTKALKSGKGLITINAEGLEAELGMVLEKIIQLAQIRSNEEGFSALLGT